MVHPSFRVRAGYVAAAAGLAAVAGWLVYQASPPSLAAPEVLASGILRTDSVSRVARAAAPSVVFLHTVSATRPTASSRSPSPRPLFPAPPWAQGQVREGLGSGVVIDSAGLVLTNAHVVEGAQVVHLRTADGDDIDTTVVGTDSVTDLALLRASDATGLRAAPLGDSDRLDVGEWVVAIGSPFGLHHTVTVGIISAKSRQLTDEGIELLQTDAPINPGNSGGPLLDLQGRVVGINSGLVSAGGESIGLNFAIPINLARAMLPQLRTGNVRHGWMGVATELVSQRRMGALGLGTRPPALQVTALAPTGPAAAAGLRPGDLILGLATDPAQRVQAISQIVATSPPGTVVRLRIHRAGGEFVLPVTLGPRPQ